MDLIKFNPSIKVIKNNDGLILNMAIKNNALDAINEQLT